MGVRVRVGVKVEVEVIVIVGMIVGDESEGKSKGKMNSFQIFLLSHLSTQMQSGSSDEIALSVDETK